MSHACPWCGKVIPLGQTMLGKTGYCPSCRGKIQIPASPAGAIGKVAPPPGAEASAFADEPAASHDPLELADGPPEPPKRPSAVPPVQAGPMPGDSNWRPFLSSAERTRPTKAVAGAGGIVFLIMFIVFLRISCMGAQRASQSKSELRTSPGAPSVRSR
ncbi:MAG: hypothetical protein AAB074_12150 [Planctomycetota bacterium]